MKHFVFIVAICSISTVQAQVVERDVKSWLSDDIEVNQPMDEMPNRLRKYKYKNGLLLPSYSSLPQPVENKLSYKALAFKPYSNYLSPFRPDIRYAGSTSWKPNDWFNVRMGGLDKDFFAPRNMTGVSMDVNFRIANGLYLNMFGYYMANNYNNPTAMPSALYQSEIGVNLTYHLSSRFRIKGGMQYQYDIAKRRWEYFNTMGIAFVF